MSLGRAKVRYKMARNSISENSRYSDLVKRTFEQIIRSRGQKPRLLYATRRSDTKWLLAQNGRSSEVQVW